MLNNIYLHLSKKGHGMENVITFSPILIVFILVLSIIFRGGNKGFFWVLVLVYIIVSALVLRLIAGIVIYALPKSAVVEGLHVPYLIGFSSFLMFVLPFLHIILCDGKKMAHSIEKSGGWFFWVAGIGLQMVGLIVMGVGVYYRDFLNWRAVSPNAATYACVVLIMFGSGIMYYSSRFNDVVSKNSLRWLSLISTVGVTAIVILFMLVLIFAVPSTIKVTYPFLAGVLSLTVVTMGIFCVWLAKDYIIGD